MLTNCSDIPRRLCRSFGAALQTGPETWPNDTQMWSCLLFISFFSTKKTHQEAGEGKNKGEKEETLPQAVVGGLECSMPWDAVDVQCLRENLVSSWTRNPSGSAVNCTEGRSGSVLREYKAACQTGPFSTYPCSLLIELLRLGKTF